MNRLRINVVVTCTARKTRPAPAGARLMTVRGATIVARFEEWRQRLNVVGAKPIKAIDLYCGNAWSVIRKLYEDPVTGPRIRLWIVSAGQGLLSPDTLVVPYAATFARRHPDSIFPEASRREEAEEWWNALVEWRRAKGQELASIADIACTFPEAPLLVAVSEEYLTALHTDLEEARVCLHRRGGMIIISAGARKEGPLAENFLPCDSRFEHRFGRGRIALNVKILSSVVAEYTARELSIGKLREHYRELLEVLPKASYPKRVRMSDDDMRKFIRGQFRIEPTTGHTKLLRVLRQRGLACEQGRFRELYREIARDA